MRRAELKLVYSPGVMARKEGSSVRETGSAHIEAMAQRGLAAARWLANVLWPSRTASRPRRVRVLEVMPLGARRELMLVSCEGERFLLAAGPDSITSMMRVRPEHRGPDAPGSPQPEPVNPWR